MTTWVRDERQKVAVCRRLCEFALLERDPRGARLLVELAWAAWDGQRGPDPDELFNHLERRSRRVTFTLALAGLDSPDAVDRWLDETDFLVKE